MSGAPSIASRVHAFVGPDHLWRELRIARLPAPCPALFLDRDGVIIEEKGYLSDPAEVELLPGVVELIQASRSRGMPVVEVTNQAGIGRGMYGWAEFAAVEARMTELLAAQGVGIDAVFACPFHPDSEGRYRHDNHPWRKPNPGMFFEAARLLNLDLAKSLLVGDKASDIEAARMAGLPMAVHVLTGHGREHAAASQAVATTLFRVIVARDAWEAATLARAAVQDNG